MQNYITAIIFLIIGIFSILAGVNYYKEIKNKYRDFVDITGTVVNCMLVGFDYEKYKYIFQFETLDGQQIEMKDNLYHSEPIVGTLNNVKLKYNPKNPNDFIMLKDEKDMLNFNLIPILLGISLIVSGIVILL